MRKPALADVSSDGVPIPPGGCPENRRERVLGSRTRRPLEVGRHFRTGRHLRDGTGSGAVGNTLVHRQRNASRCGKRIRGPGEKNQPVDPDHPRDEKDPEKDDGDEMVDITLVVDPACRAGRVRPVSRQEGESVALEAARETGKSAKKAPEWENIFPLQGSPERSPTNSPK